MRPCLFLADLRIPNCIYLKFMLKLELAVTKRREFHCAGSQDTGTVSVLGWCIGYILLCYILDRSNLKEQGVILVHSLGVQSVMVGKVRQPELGAACPSVSAVTRQKVLNTGSPLAFSSFFGPEHQPSEWCCSHFWWLFPPQLTQSRYCSAGLFSIVILNSVKLTLLNITVCHSGYRDLCFD